MSVALGGDFRSSAVAVLRVAGVPRGWAGWRSLALEACAVCAGLGRAGALGRDGAPGRDGASAALRACPARPTALQRSAVTLRASPSGPWTSDPGAAWRRPATWHLEAAAGVP